MPLVRLTYNEAIISLKAMLKIRDSLQSIVAICLVGEDGNPIDEKNVVVHVWPFGKYDLNHKFNFDVVIDAHNFPARLETLDARNRMIFDRLRVIAPMPLTYSVQTRLMPYAVATTSDERVERLGGFDVSPSLVMAQTALESP